MRMFKPLSWLMVLVVGTAFAADGTTSRTTSGMAAVSNNVVAQSSRATERGMTRNDDMSRVGGDLSLRTTSRSALNNERGTPQASSGVASRNSVNARSASNVAERQSSDVRSTTTARRVGVTARAKGTETGRQIAARVPSDNSSERVATKTVSKESIAEAKEILEQTAELNKSCQEQYNECMDQFCAIVDSNQKRCSCSSNLTKYKKVEDAVNAANSKLNEVAQNIRYIGLSADEIRAIMTATEAEEALSGTKDNTENRTMLEQIEKMIKDPQTSSASYSGDNFGLDMDLDFSSDSSDIFSLDFLGTNNTTSFSNLRGTELYSAARNRCSTVLNQCKRAGATTQQITGNYDLSIDKDCIAYEAGLKKMNETLVSNVRSAERMLQKARLAVLQNKNQYDAKGCISALETCMIDDMVCGEGYTKCVDPTKRYIDENGEVVLGQNISSIKEFMKEYNNADITAGFLEDAYKNTTFDNCTTDGKCTVKYLLQKIGTGQKVTDEGLCRAVLDKCQRYTYDGDTYKAYNDVVVNYVQRAMVNIKAAQQKIISDYASSCMVDVASCYNQQVTQVNSWTSSASTNSIYNVMNGACRSVALTCGFAIFVGDPDITGKTIVIDGKDYSVNGCPGAADATSSIGQKNSAIIGCVSEMFYQSLLCPDNSEFQMTSGTAGENGYVNTQCKCKSGYEVQNGYCVRSCGANATRVSGTGVCQCKEGYTGDGYTCNQE